MKHLVIILFILSFIRLESTCLANSIRLQSIIETETPMEQLQDITYYFSSSNNLFYYLKDKNTTLSNTNTIIYYTINFSNHYQLKQDTFFLPENNHLTSSTSGDLNIIKDFWIFDTILYFATYSGIYQYKIVGKNLSFIRLSKYYKGRRNRKSFQPRFFYINNNEIYPCQINHPSSFAKTQHLQNETIEYDYINYLNFDIPCYNNISPNKYLLCINKNSICVLQTLDYKIEVFDKNMNLIHSFKNIPENWKAISKKDKETIKSKYDAYNSYDCVMCAFELEEKKKYSRVIKIHSIFDDYIMVHGYHNALNTFFIDFWDLENPKKEKFKTSYIFTPFDDNTVINKENIFNYLMGDFNSSRKSFIAGNHIIILESAADGVSPFAKTAQEYLNEKEKVFLEKSPILRLYIFSIIL